MTKKDAPLEVISEPAVVELNDAPELTEEAPVESPKVGDTDYDWSAHYDTDDLYTHTFPDGKVVALRTFKSIYSRTWLYKIRNLKTDIDFEFAAIDRAACETAQEVLASVDDVDGDPIKELFTAWMASGTSRGDGDEGLTPGN